MRLTSSSFPTALNKAAPDLQLHLIVPFATNFTPHGGPVYSGIGDIEFGAKYRLVKEGPVTPEVGIFPFIELPTGDAAEGLGVGETWYRLPLWLQKSWGPWPHWQDRCLQ